MEILKEIPIEGADFQYFASTLGKIYRWNGKDLRELKGWDHYYKKWNHHYRRYGIKINGKFKNVYGQRLVLLAFAGPPPNSNDVARHGPNGSLDNRPCQLTWGTHKENINEDRKRDGNYYNRGRKKKVVEEPETERWDHDPEHDAFWDKIVEDHKNGVVINVPF